MEPSSKLCNTKVDDDRLTSLPDELLIWILSLLPTKDVTATSVSSKRLRRVFPLITALDFDVSHISHCVKHPYAIERFPTFVAFVDNSLSAYKSHYLTKFRLRLGIDFFTRYVAGCSISGRSDELGCSVGCLPDLKFAHLHAWISFPLTLYGLRELDLCIIIRDPGNGQLPPAIFMCQTLEVLKLEVNFGLDQVSAMPSYCLPKLKLLCLCASSVLDDSFLPRLVSSCPVLEDLAFNAIIKHVHHATIHSLSLRRLCLTLYRHLPGFRGDKKNFVDFRTPNLEYLEYADDLALGYSIPVMHSLVEAKLDILETLEYEPPPIPFESTLELLRLVSYVQHLTLCEHFSQELDCNKVKDQLPVFPNLNHLTLDCAPENYFWDKILWAFLNCSPVLEILVFRTGLSVYFEEVNNLVDSERLKSELDFFRAARAIPSCCKYHLKRIVINIYFGLEREIAIIQFLLSHSLVLEELVICRAQEDDYPMCTELLSPVPSIEDPSSVESTLKNLPRASATCTIKVL